MTDTHKIEVEEGEKEKLPCCEEKKQEKSIDSKNAIFLKLKKNPAQALVAILAIVVAINIIVMTFFTVTVNKKLGEAIDLTRSQKGEVILVLPLDCPSCGDLSVEKSKLVAENVDIIDDKMLSNNSEEAKKLIDELGLQNLPALIFRSEEKIKDQLVRSFENSSRLSGENILVWEKSQPPYFDTDTNSVSGLVKATYITDNRCADCYDVIQIQRPILQRFGLALVSEKTVDVSDTEGQTLLDQYNISSVPTVILSSEASAYEALNNVWPQVGTIEKDGAYIFRELAALGVVYKDLKTGQTIEPAE